MIISSDLLHRVGHGVPFIYIYIRIIECQFMDLDFTLSDSKIRIAQIRSKTVEITLLQKLIRKTRHACAWVSDNSTFESSAATKVKCLKQTCEMKEAKGGIIVLQTNIENS